MYDDMKFRMIKFVLNDMYNCRRALRDYHEKGGLQIHQDAVRNLFESLVIMVSPVMTRWSERIWCNVLKNTKDVKFRKGLVKNKKGGKKKKDGGATAELLLPRRRYVSLSLFNRTIYCGKKRTLE